LAFSHAINAAFFEAVDSTPWRIVGIREGGGQTLAHFPKRHLVGTVYHHYRFGRTMFGGKGLYTNLEGNWLWGFRDSDDDRYELWKID
jgi:hypothetical protein